VFLVLCPAVNRWAMAQHPEKGPKTGFSPR